MAGARRYVGYRTTGMARRRNQKAKHTMARRKPAKPARRTTKPKAPAIISTFLDLPGAIFIGGILDGDLEIARYWQEIREEYEQTGSITTLWHTLDGEGWPT